MKLTVREEPIQIGDWETVYAVVSPDSEPGDYAIAIFAQKHEALAFAEIYPDEAYEIEEWDVSNRAFMQIA